MAIVGGLVVTLVGVYLSRNVPGFGHSEFSGLDLNWGLTIATVGMFIALIPLIDLFYFTPLRDAINHRNNELESTFTEAENLRTEMTKMRADYEQRLATTEANAREQIQNQIKEAQNLRTSLMSEAAGKAEALKKQAEQEIEADKNRVLGELRGHVVDMSLLAAEKVIGENMDNDRNRKMIADLIDKAEVKV